MALVLKIWIRSRVCSSAEISLNHRLNRRPVFILHRFNRCLSLCGSVSASSLEQPPTVTPMATGASDGLRMNRRLSIGSTGATAWSFCPCSVSGPYSCRCTDAIGCSDASVTVLPVPLLTMFSSQSDLVKVTPVFTPMPMSLHHRTFRCFRVDGPACPVLIIQPAGPACQPHSSLLHANSRARAPAPPPVRRRRARARHSKPPPLPISCAAAPLPLARNSAARTQPPLPLSRGNAALAPCLRHPRSASHPPRRCSPSPPGRLLLSTYVQLPSDTNALDSRTFFRPPHPLVRVHARCSRNCLLGFFFDFFSTDSQICKGMVLPLLACDVSSCSYPLHTCLHISLPCSLTSNLVTSIVLFRVLVSCYPLDLTMIGSYHSMLCLRTFFPLVYISYMHNSLS